MKDGDIFKRNLAGQLSKRIAGKSPVRIPVQRSTSAPVRPSLRGGRQDPVSHMLENPLFLAADVKRPDSPSTGYNPFFREGAPADLPIEVEAFSESGGSPSPHLHRRSSYGSFSTAADNPLHYQDPDSPPAQSPQDEIVEEPGTAYYDNTLDAHNHDLLGGHTPPPGYSLKEESPLRRFIKDAHRIWIAPALAGIPTFVDNWWKTRQARRSEASAKAATKGAGAALQGLRDRSLSLTPGQLFSTRIAGGVLLFLVLAFLIYAFFEHRRKNNEVVLETGRRNLSRNTVIALVPKERYLIERARVADEDAMRLAHPPPPLRKKGLHININN